MDKIFHLKLSQDLMGTKFQILILTSLENIKQQHIILQKRFLVKIMYIVREQLLLLLKKLHIHLRVTIMKRMRQKKGILTWSVLQQDVRELRELLVSTQGESQLCLMIWIFLISHLINILQMMKQVRGELLTLTSIRFMITF